jgi:Alpha/beta hydrolase domain
MSYSRVLLPTIAVLLLHVPARAEVVGIDIRERTPFAEGRSFGDVGPYEKVVGIVRFALDPKAAANRKIVDLELAPRNAKGLVEFEADFEMLCPKDLARGNGAILYDVNNRGNRIALNQFNRSPFPDAEELARPERNGFLMRRGYTIVWSGWIGELLPGDDRLLLKAPPVLEAGKAVHGSVRFEFSCDKPTKSLSLSRREAHGCYPPTADGEAKATLTKRNLEGDPRTPISRDQWKLVRGPIPKVEHGVAGTLPPIRCELEGGFEPGVLYEVIYEAEGAIVQGVGLAGVRDLVTYLKHDSPESHRDGRPNVLSRAHGFGVSQSGRFLRHFLWQGFNLDEKGRMVFDGLMPHVAGGGLGYFNQRFAQPTRANGQHEDHLYPCDVFPFTYGPTTDPFTKKTDGILAAYDRTQVLPKIMHTQTSSEYWNRSGSLVHTDPLGKKDVEIPDNVRIYSFSGTQHGPAAFPPEMGIGQNLPNPADYRPILRALLDRLDAWVREGKTPPVSHYPLKRAKQLLPIEEAAKKWPAVPGVTFPKVIQQPPFADYGPDVPVVKGKYVVLVPQYRKGDVEEGFLPLADIEAPIATYTGWNLRRKEVGAEGQLASLLGSYLPLPKTRADAGKANDPRKSLEELHGSFATYVKAYGNWCIQLERAGYLLDEDATKLRASRERFRPLFEGLAEPKKKTK